MATTVKGTPMHELDFYFDFRSPYSYLAHSQLDRLGVKVAYLPIDMRSLMAQVGNVPTSVTCAAKNRYVQADLGRWAAHYGVPLARHPQAAEIDGRRLLRAAFAAEPLGVMPAAVKAILHARWAAPAPLTTAAEISAVLVRAGLDREPLLSMIDDPAMDETLESATAAAAARGVFGAPTIFVGDDMFFGNDRLHFVQDQLARAA
jgi:2-hydroxychromene-2-carboxylate isomerase